MTLDRTTELLETESYPLTADDLRNRHGDHEMSLPNGEETLGEVIERSGAESFESAFDAQQTVRGTVSHKAIGRKGYSDRDPTPMGVDGPEPLSF